MRTFCDIWYYNILYLSHKIRSIVYVPRSVHYAPNFTPSLLAACKVLVCGIQALEDCAGHCCSMLHAMHHATHATCTKIAPVVVYPYSLSCKLGDFIKLVTASIQC